MIIANRLATAAQRTVRRKTVQDTFSLGLSGSHREIFLSMRTQHSQTGMYSVMQRTGKIYSDNAETQMILSLSCDQILFRRQTRRDGGAKRYSESALMRFHERSIEIAQMQWEDWSEWAFMICDSQRT